MSKLKFKLKENPIGEFSFDYLKDYLESLGIEKTESFIKDPSPEDEESYNNLENIDEMVEELYFAFENDKKFFLQVDSDTDGYTSSAIFYLFFKELYPNARIEWRLHDGKEHGVITDTVPIDADYIIIPDAGSMQFDEHEELSRRGYKILIMDHHLVDKIPEHPGLIVVNNQNSPRFINKSLSGAGVVYKVIQAFNERYAEKFPQIHRNYIDLAALGIVADMMDTRTLDNNFIIHYGLKNIQNPMFLALLEKQQFSIERSGASILEPTKITLAFYVAPLINAVIRFGTKEEKEELFEGFILTDNGRIKETQYKGEVRKENFHDYVARISTNIRARQNREKTKSMEFLKHRIEEEGLDKEQLLIVITSKDDEVPVPQTITGLVAMELLKEYKKPVLVLRPKSDGEGGTMYAGSGRGKQNGEFNSLLELLRESELCEFVEGHDMAHGVGIKEANMKAVVDYANLRLKDVEFDVENIEVDYIFRNATINREMISAFGRAMYLYGNGIPQPKFAFTLNVAADAIRLVGKNQNVISFNIEGVDFVSFSAAKAIQEMKENSSSLYEINLVGRAQINEWQGREKPQIMIDEIDIKPIGLADLF